MGTSRFNTSDQDCMDMFLECRVVGDICPMVSSVEAHAIVDACVNSVAATAAQFEAYCNHLYLYSRHMG